MGDVDYRLALARTRALIDNGQTLGEIARATARANRIAKAQAERLSTADALSEATGLVLIALFKTPGAFERMCQSNHELRARASMLHVAKNAYDEACKDEQDARKP